MASDELDLHQEDTIIELDPNGASGSFGRRPI